ncbi:MAG: alpha/beta hydrolase [Candidatus Helarchaeota archaeon]|nr:alpha/beta hydrolase [Candidatus Helarchaeota archaeon]
MPYFDNEGIKIYYEIEGSGPDLFMIHGFAANIDFNWRVTNWIKVLKNENRLILIDCRGHGKSDKPTDPAQYGSKMMEDVIKLMDHLSIRKSNFFGYSMGARITLGLLIREQERMNSAILGGYGLNLPSKASKQSYFKPGSGAKVIINALKAESLDQIEDAIAREFRKFAESTGGNLNALAAIMESSFQDLEEEFSTRSKIRKAFKKVKVPVMTVLGSNDFLIQNKTLISNLIPRSCHFQIQGRDHLTVVPDRKFHMVVKAFLNLVNSKKI